MIKAEDILQKLKNLSCPKNIAGMAKFGINPANNLGVSVVDIRKIAKGIPKNHALAQKLWDTGIRDARMVACLVEDVKAVTEKQMDRWVKDFNSWDICDHCCGSLFDKTPFAYKKITEWTKRKEEFVKRAGFVVLAWIALHDKKAEDKVFLEFLPLIKKEATDERNFVKKAVNWALRHIGKRNFNLNKAAIETAKEIQKINSKTAKWIASDAIKELTSEAVKRRLKKKQKLISEAA